MAGLKEQAVWENEIYQIEENDPVHGGEDGITNKPAKQLANRTLYLRNLLTLAGQKIVPKTITATSTNTADETGHTHAIAHGTTGQKGIVQLTNDTGLDSEALALTAKAGKKLAQEIAQNRQKTVELANQKVNKSDVSDAVNSTSQTQVASSRAVKTAYDLAASKQSPATTLEGYGITDAVMVKGHQSVNLDQLLNRSAVWRVTGANKDVVGFTDKNIYNFGVGLTLASGPCAGMLYMPHATVKPKLYLKSSYASYTPSPWEEVAMVDDVVKKTGDTMTGRLSLSHFACGSYVSQKDSEAPFFVREHNANGISNYFPAIKTRIRNGDGWVANFSVGYTSASGRNQWGEGIILLNEDNGNHKFWRFTHDGDLISAKDVVADNGYRLKNTHQIGQPHVQVTTTNWGGGKN